MLFNSVEFLIFFCVFFVIYWMAHKNLTLQNRMLLLGGYLFYGWWDVRFLFLIAFSTVLDFNFALKIDRGQLDKSVRIKTLVFLILAGIFFLLLDFNPGASAAGQSVVFRPQYMSVFLLVISYFLVLYGTDQASSRWKEEQRRKVFLIIGVATNLLLLGVFKYFNFFLDSFISLFEKMTGGHANVPVLNIVLPVGLSFYTFQSISYVVDVYRRQTKPTERFLDYAAYIIFFPQLVAGPIERARHLLPQFLKIRPSLTKDDFNYGMWLIVWGLYKKVVIADNLAKIVNTTFMPYDQGQFVVPHDGFRLLVAVYAFALQIYGDFSGYTDMARGLAKLLGFDIILNFNLPYFARTPSDFWKRWHISLSSWLRDYLYIPLGGNRGNQWFVYRNLMLTMALGGLWHGASWTFLYWGVFHGFILCVYKFLNISEDKKYPSWGIPVLQGIVMFHLTCMGWLLFRAKNMETVAVFIRSVFGHFHVSPLAWENFFLLFKYSWVLIAFQLVQFYSKNLFPLNRAHWFIKLNVYLFLIMSILCFTDSKPQEFIYFAF
ncbi:MAG: MBOAT family protein [Candidatus Omnitrophica bacterium]|nr:MBOAT family protein [Candidatus Omnitrophota bacterium]